MTDLDSLLKTLNAQDSQLQVIDDIAPPPADAIEAPDIPPPPPPVDEAIGDGIDLDDLLEVDVTPEMAEEVSMAQKEAEMLVSGEIAEDSLAMTDEEKEFETPEQRTLRVIRIKDLNPGLPKYKLKVRLLDETENEYEVTSDWGVGNLIACISENLGIGEGV